MTEVIHFYLAGEEHGYLSNFSAYPIFLSGKRWPTSEHYFQAQKFLDEQLQMQICHANGPRRAAEMGRDRKAVKDPGRMNRPLASGSDAATRVLLATVTMPARNRLRRTRSCPGLPQVQTAMLAPA